MRRSRMIALTGAVALATTALGVGGECRCGHERTDDQYVHECGPGLPRAGEGGVLDQDLSRTLARAGAKVNRTKRLSGW